MAKYRCPKCKKVFSRDLRQKQFRRHKGKKSIKSICEATMHMVRCKRID